MKKKILIVEDNADLLQVLQLQLEDRGYETILASNGKQAVDFAAAQVPDLILMDIRMPEMDGFQATRLIRQNPKTRSIPIIAVTVLETHERELCLQSGCDDYIPKPFTFSLLFSHIDKLLMKSSGNLGTLPS